MNSQLPEQSLKISCPFDGTADDLFKYVLLFEHEIGADMPNRMDGKFPVTLKMMKQRPLTRAEANEMGVPENAVGYFPSGGRMEIRRVTKKRAAVRFWPTSDVERRFADALIAQIEKDGLRPPLFQEADHKSLVASSTETASDITRAMAEESNAIGSNKPGRRSYDDDVWARQELEAGRESSDVYAEWSRRPGVISRGLDNYRESFRKVVVYKVRKKSGR